MHTKKIKPIASRSSLICFCIVLLCSLANCANVNRRTIENPDLKHWDEDRQMHTNLFPPKFAKGEVTEFDSIDFLKPGEKNRVPTALFIPLRAI